MTCACNLAACQHVAGALLVMAGGDDRQQSRSWRQSQQVLGFSR